MIYSLFSHSQKVTQCPGKNVLCLNVILTMIHLMFFSCIKVRLARWKQSESPALFYHAGTKVPIPRPPDEGTQGQPVELISQMTPVIKYDGELFLA